MKLYIQIEGQTIIVHSTYHRGLVDMKPTYNGGKLHEIMMFVLEVSFDALERA